MKRNSALLYLWVVLLSSSVKGQDDLAINRSLQDFASRMHFTGNIAGIGNSSAGNSFIEGSEYINAQFVKGDLLTRSAGLFSGIPMRYNAYLDNIEVKLPDSLIYNLSDPSLIFRVRLKKDVLIYMHYLSTFGERSGFLFILQEGNCSLYRRNYKVYNERIPSNGIINEVPAKIVDKPKEYYVALKDKMPTIILSKKDLLQLLNDHSSEMEDFLKKEKVKMNSDEDLKKVLIYYNSL